VGNTTVAGEIVTLQLINKSIKTGFIAPQVASDAEALRCDNTPSGGS